MRLAGHWVKQRPRDSGTGQGANPQELCGQASHPDPKSFRPYRTHRDASIRLPLLASNALAQLLRPNPKKAPPGRRMSSPVQPHRQDLAPWGLQQAQHLAQRQNHGCNHKGFLEKHPPAVQGSITDPSSTGKAHGFPTSKQPSSCARCHTINPFAHLRIPHGAFAPTQTDALQSAGSARHSRVPAGGAVPGLTC